MLRSESLSQEKCLIRRCMGVDWDNSIYVNIRIAGELSREQKAKIAAEITDTLERIAHKPKSYTYIAFDELPDENWAIAGKLLDEE